MGSGFQSRGGGTGGITSIGGKYTGLGSFSVYDQNIGQFVENFFYASKASSGSGRFKALDQAGPPPISAKENAEIDEAIKSGEAIPAAVLKGRELFEKQAHAVINPIRLPDFVNTGPPPIIPTVAVTPPRVPVNRFPTPKLPSSPSVSRAPSWDTGPGASSYPSTVSVPQTNWCVPVNLSGILGGITSIASTVGSLASTYYGVRAARAGLPQQALAAPPAVTPAAPIAMAMPRQLALAATPAAAIAQTAAYTPSAGGFAGGATLAGTSMIPFGLVGKALGIAAALGLSVDVVDAVLKMGTPKRRRKRLLTKSDVADISTMAALLGKNSEAFKTWLAVSRR